MRLSETHVVRGPTLRDKIMTVVGVMPAEVLVLHHHVPHRNVLQGTGYQRNPGEKRVTQLAHGIERRKVDLPTSVLLNLRDVKEEDVLEKTGADSYFLRLDPDKASDEHRLFVVDGQHRILALQKALDDYEANVENIKIPFVCMVGADEMREMEQFHVVNSNAKSVPTDLAFSLMKARAEHDPEFAERIEERGRKWEIDAQSLTERLVTSSNTWKDCIRLPNTPKGETTVPSGSFVRSLKPLLTQSALFQSIKSPEKQVQVIDAYWRAIRRVLPEAFESSSNYSIQKGVGVEVLHSIFPYVLELARSSDGSLYQPESYELFLDKALNGIAGLNGEGESVQGADFWRTGRMGAAGIFATAAGRRRLAGYLRTQLPEPDL